MVEQALTKAEQAVIDREMRPWAKTVEVISAAPGRKLLRVVASNEGDFYFTLLGDQEPRLIIHEPVSFDVVVHAAQGPCRAGHKVGDHWEFDWCTPVGLCGSAYHTMYPLLHGLMLTAGRYEGPAGKETLISCPDEGCVTFRIERHRWLPSLWK
jgi:uncharacterized repeat protein (TIGR04076 family)